MKFIRININQLTLLLQFQFFNDDNDDHDHNMKILHYDDYSNDGNNDDDLFRIWVNKWINFSSMMINSFF